MVQIIAGNKGKGKTKYLLDMANTAVKEAIRRSADCGRYP